MTDGERPVSGVDEVSQMQRIGDEVNPTQTCDVCERSRDCLLHLRAEFPPGAACKWLQRTCTHPDTPCRESSDVIAYRAGVA